MLRWIEERKLSSSVKFDYTDVHLVVKDRVRRETVKPRGVMEKRRGDAEREE